MISAFLYLQTIYSVVQYWNCLQLTDQVFVFGYLLEIYRKYIWLFFKCHHPFVLHYFYILGQNSCNIDYYDYYFVLLLIISYIKKSLIAGNYVTEKLLGNSVSHLILSTIVFWLLNLYSLRHAFKNFHWNHRNCFLCIEIGMLEQVIDISI